MKKIGLVDVDGHAKKKKWGATIYPNLALAKIARYWKEQGGHVEWATPMQHYDVVYMSKVFKFTPDDLHIYDADEIVKGGTGYDVESRLPDEIDHLQPDYSIYPNVPKDMAYGFLTRGCPNRCAWCVVPQKEGHIRPYMDVDDIAIEGRRKLVLMDNNILAAGDYCMAQLEKIIERGYRVDFNQALDARLVTDDVARLLARVKWLDNNRIRFGCDTRGQIEECERAMALINRYGFTGQYFLYTMIGGKSDFRESYERVNYWWKRMQAVRAAGEGRPVYAYAQPYRNPNNAREVIPQWQKDLAGWVNKKAHFVAHSFEDFEPRKGFRCKRYLEEAGMSTEDTETGSTQTLRNTKNKQHYGI